MTQQNMNVGDGKFDNSIVAYNATVNLEVNPAALEALFKLVWERFEAGLGKRTTNKAWQDVEWEEAAKRYAQKMARLYGTMQVLGMPEPVLLTGIYTDVNLLDKPTAWQRYSREQLEEEFTNLSRRYRKQNRRNGFQVVQQKDKLFVLGKPGAGKTTFLKYIALQAVEGRIVKVPIFVSLNELADSNQELLEFIVKQFQICNFPDARAFVEQLLKRGQALVLFDGLDEVQQEGQKRATLIRELNNFIRQYDASQVIITCRIAATDYMFENFSYVEMADFTPAQVEAFVAKWFQNDEPKRKGFLEELAKEYHQGLREMTQNPLQLILLCLTYEETLTFPARRVEIYEEALDGLLKKWDSSRNIRRSQRYRKLSVRRKQKMLASIAFETFQEEKFLIPQRKLVILIEAYLRRLSHSEQDEQIDGLAVLKTICAQHGIFTECARKLYSFTHLTFQEYFTAKYIVNNAIYGTLRGLIDHHATNERWREVFLLTATLLDNPEIFFEWFIKRLNRLVTKDEQLMKLFAWVNAKASCTLPDYKPAMVRSFYIYLTLNRTLDNKRQLNLNVDPTLDYVRTIARDLAFSLDPTHDLALDLALSLDYALESARSLNKTYTSSDSNLSKITDSSLQRAINATKQLGLDALHKALQNLSIPQATASLTEWQAYRVKLEGIMREHNQLEQNWQLTREQIEHLERYLKATQLLVDCLQLADVSDRQAIKERLLLPPRGSG